MKIKLENFRCYENKEFDLGDNGLVLISGASGAGKSTILNAIYFCLFGEGNKIVSHGKTSCKVEMEINLNKHMKISRTKRPNRLVLEVDDDTIQDQAAQDIINRLFGDMFDVSGYISQNGANSFILMNPADKLTFLERFAFKDIDLTNIKGRCKAVIKKRHDQHIKSIAEYEMANKVVSELAVPEKLSFPLKHKNRDNKDFWTEEVVEKLLKNEDIKQKNTKVFIKKALKSIKEFESEINNIKIRQNNIRNKKELLDNLNIKLSKLQSQEIPYLGDEYLKDLDIKLDYIKSTKKLQTLRTKLHEDISQLVTLKEQEMTNFTKELESINLILWQDYKRDEIDDIITTNSEYITYIEELQRLNKEVERLKKKMTVLPILKDLKDLKSVNLEDFETKLSENRNLIELAKIQDKIYECPSCDEKLTIPKSGNKLCTVKKTTKSISSITENINILEKECLELEAAISFLKDYNVLLVNIDIMKNDPANQYDSELSTDLDELRTDLEHLKKYRYDHLVLEKRKQIIEKNITNSKFSSTITSLEENIDRQKNSIRELEKITPSDVNKSIDYSSDEIRTIIEVQKQYRDKITSIDEQTSGILKEIKEIEIYLSENKEGSDLDPEDVLKSITLKEEEIKVLEKELETHTSNLQKIEKYKQYQKDQKIYNSWIEKKEILEKQEQKDRLKYASSTLLMEKILEAESIAITNIINSINTHAQLYLDCFFPDNPISVKLLSFKESKKANIQSKPQINIAIEYKGMECDISSLSGGELARVVLSFTLALAEMFNTPLIMLDECTSSLDEELSTTIINGLKENFSNKLVIVISHQNICGLYDRILSIA